MFTYLLKNGLAKGNSVEFWYNDTDDVILEKLSAIDGLHDLVVEKIKNKNESILLMEIVLHGLAELNIISREMLDDKISFNDALADMFDDILNDDDSSFRFLIKNKNMMIEINPYNPDTRMINSVIEKMKDGAVIIYPTDSVYAMGCDPNSKKGVEKMFQIKNSDPAKTPLTFMCDSISIASEYANQISNSNFRFIKDHTPGPLLLL